MIDPIILKLAVVLLSFGSATEVYRGSLYWGAFTGLLSLFTQFVLL